MREKAPDFDLINIIPAWIVGRAERAKTSNEVEHGANNLIIGFLRGARSPVINCGFVNSKDCAEAHVRALNPDVKGNQFFILGRNESMVSLRAITEDKFPDDFKDDIFRDDGEQPTVAIPINTKKTEAELGVRLMSTTQLVEDLVRQYVELKKQESTQRYVE